MFICQKLHPWRGQMSVVEWNTGESERENLGFMDKIRKGLIVYTMLLRQEMVPAL